MECPRGCVTSDQQLLNEHNFQYDVWQDIVNFTFVSHWYQYDLLSSKYEANELKMKSLFGGEQVKDNTEKGKLFAWPNTGNRISCRGK